METWAENPKIHMKNPEVVRRKIQTLSDDGPSVLQVVSDFDHTISRSHFEGRKIKSSFCVMEEDPKLFTEEERKEFQAINQKYLAFEVDPTISREERIPHMIEWWAQSFNKFVEVGITEKSLKDIAETGAIRLRCRTLEMFKVLEANDIPCLVFSAGLGEVVINTLKFEKAHLSNVTVVSNFFKFHESADGSIKAEAPKNFLHTYNKNAGFPVAVDYFASEEIRSRKNAILLGDNFGDSHMVDGAPGIIINEGDNSTEKGDEAKGSTVLKVGFLNSHVEERLAAFKEHFDIVLVDDQTMDVPLEVLKKIVQKI